VLIVLGVGLTSGTLMAAFGSADAVFAIALGTMLLDQRDPAAPFTKGVTFQGSMRLLL
jgi:hypothetical protein